MKVSASRVPAFLLVLSLAVLGALGASSVNYGEHWDETNITRSVRDSYETGVFLPHWYNYPSVAYDLSVLAAAPRVWAGGPAALGVTDAVLRSPALARVTPSARFTLQLRAFFFLVTLLAGLAAWLLVARLTGSGWAALFAALALAGSWEFFYQARWIAPDGLVLLFAGFALWAQHRALEPEPGARVERRLVLASVLTGLTAGAKYPGAIAVIPLALAALGAPAPGRAARWRRVATSALVAAATFLATTPGGHHEPRRFAANIAHEMQHYGTGHGGYTVTPGLDHFSKQVVYLGAAFFSENRALAVLGSAFALAGVAALRHRRARVVLWFASLPVVTIAWLSTQHVMIVRNDLVLFFPLAVLAGLGAFEGWRALSATRARFVVPALAILLVAFNLGFLAHAAWSVDHLNEVSQKVALERRLRAAPRTRFCLSPRAEALLDSVPAFHPANVVGTLDSADRFVFVSSEVRDWDEFAANRLGYYRTVWKAMEDVDWDYYPTWPTARMVEVPARERTSASR